MMQQGATDKVVFVTGAGGFAGSYIARLLVQRGYTVRGLVAPGDPCVLLGDAAVERIEGRLDDWEALENGMRSATAVVHAAGSRSFDPSKKRQLGIDNLLGTRMAVNAAIECGIPHFLQLSSVAALGLATDPQSLSEDSAWQDSTFNTLYARSKFAAEREVWRAGQEGLPISIVNAGWILGAGKWHRGSCRLLRDIHRGLPYYPTGSFSFIDVRDLAAVVVKNLQSGPSADRLVAAPIHSSWQQVFETAAQALEVPTAGKAMPAWYDNYFHYRERLQAFFTGKERLGDRVLLRVARGRFQFNSHRPELLKDLTFRSLQESLQDAARAFHESKKRGDNYGLLPAE